MSASAILIIATDALAGALLGAAVELAGYAPVFPRDGENAREALRRTKPCAVLVDCDDEESCGDAFFGPALMLGAAVAVFTSSRSTRVLEPIAREYAVQTFSLPVDIAELKSVLDACARKSGA
jgi:DNA-binding NtrC family response regulator